MNEDSLGMSCLGGCGSMSKWAQVTAAINEVVGMTQTSVNWGLKFFGDAAGGCAVSAGVAVPPAPNNAAAIATAIAASHPATNTPTTAAELSAGRYLSTVTTPNRKFILLATDGQPTCAAGSTLTAVDDFAAIQAVGTVKQMGFDTFVIGIATNGMAAETLNLMAEAGGRARTSLTPSYYPVSTTADLVSVLAGIQVMVAPDCTLSLAALPNGADRANVKVTADVGAPAGAVTISADAANGWSYGAGMAAIVLNGSACAQYRAGTYRGVRASFGCR